MSDNYKNQYEAKLKDLKEHPEKHHHDWNQLHACCMIDGALDLSLVDAHREFSDPRSNGSCDVVSGPCCCGGWH